MLFANEYSCFYRATELRVMFKHIVMWRFKPNISQEDKSLMKDKLEGLIKSIPALISIEVGFNCALGDVYYDVALTTVFENKLHYQSYADHPSHLEVVAFVRELVSDRAVVDYEL